MLTFTPTVPDFKFAVANPLFIWFSEISPDFFKWPIVNLHVFALTEGIPLPLITISAPFPPAFLISSNNLYPKNLNLDGPNLSNV